MANKEKNVKEKPPFYKKWWFWLVIVIVIAGMVGENEDSDNEPVDENEQMVEEVKGEENELINEASIIELIAGEQGEYGQLITMSADTDMEESFYAYYVPAGTYVVTNKGEYMTQVSVYEGFKKDEDTGYDEYTNIGDTILLDIGKSETIEIPEGWFIEIHEPTYITLELEQ